MNSPMKCLLASLAAFFILTGCNESSSEGSSAATVGTAGSTARFAIQRDYLVVISGNALKAFDLRTPNDPLVVFESSVPNSDVQTIFPYLDNYLLVGADNGMYIYEIDDTGRITPLGSMSHGRACDPVVANENIAYVTLNDVARCGEEALNELQIVDVSDLSNPELITTEPLTGPKGLAIAGTELFVCDRYALARFDVSDPTTPELLVLDGDIHCDDVIVKEGLLYATGNEVAIYRIEAVSEDSSGLTLLSTLPSTSTTIE